MKDIIKHYGEKFNFLKSLIKKEDPSIIEIGAHYGEDTLRLAHTFPEAKIYCFEPDPRNITIFKKHIKEENIFLFELALSNKDGEAEFFLSHQESSGVPSKYDWISPEDYNNLQLNNSGASSLKKGYQHALASPVTVLTSRFDTWYKNNQLKEIDFAWIDVQGAEREVVEGMGDRVNLIKYIWIEYGEMFYEGAMSKNETISLLKSKGFGLIEDQNVSNEDLLFIKI
jgi:FkbM family methyltransferase